MTLRRPAAVLPAALAASLAASCDLFPERHVQIRLTPLVNDPVAAAPELTSFVTTGGDTLYVWTGGAQPEVVAKVPGRDGALDPPYLWALERQSLKLYRLDGLRQPVHTWPVSADTRGVLAYPGHAVTWDPLGAHIFSTSGGAPVGFLGGSRIDRLAVSERPTLRFAFSMGSQFWVVNRSAQVIGRFPAPRGKRREKIGMPVFSSKGDVAVARGDTVVVWRTNGSVYPKDLESGADGLAWSADGASLVVTGRRAATWTPESDTLVPWMARTSRFDYWFRFSDGVAGASGGGFVASDGVGEVGTRAFRAFHPHASGPIAAHPTAVAFLVPLEEHGGAWVNLENEQVVHVWPDVDEAAMHPNGEMLAVQDRTDLSPLRLVDGGVHPAWGAALQDKRPATRCAPDPGPAMMGNPQFVLNGSAILTNNADGWRITHSSRMPDAYVCDTQTAGALVTDEEVITFCERKGRKALVSVIPRSGCEVDKAFEIERGSTDPVAIPGKKAFLVAAGSLTRYDYDTMNFVELAAGGDWKDVAPIDGTFALARDASGLLAKVNLNDGSRAAETWVPGLSAGMDVMADGRFAILRGSPAIVVRTSDLAWVEVAVFRDGGLVVAESGGRYWVNERGAGQIRVSSGDPFAEPWSDAAVLAGRDTSLIQDFIRGAPVGRAAAGAT